MAHYSHLDKWAHVASFFLVHLGAHGESCTDILQMNNFFYSDDVCAWDPIIFATPDLFSPRTQENHYKIRSKYEWVTAGHL